MVEIIVGGEENYYILHIQINSSSYKTYVPKRQLNSEDPEDKDKIPKSWRDAINNYNNLEDITEELNKIHEENEKFFEELYRKDREHK